MPHLVSIVTVSLNPAIDRLIEVEGFTLGAHQMGRELRRTPGGKAINVTRVLTALKTPNIATGFLGRENRTAFSPVFDSPIVSDEFIYLPGATRENITIADPAGTRETHIRDTGLWVMPEHLRLLTEKIEWLAGPGTIVVFSGSLPRGLSARAFLDLVSLAGARGAQVAVDTDGESLRAMAGRPLWSLKLNEAELDELVGRKIDGLAERIVEARMLASIVQMVLLTHGEQGAFLFTSKVGVHGHVPLKPEQVKNTVGCGDVLLGAFLSGIFAGGDPMDSFIEAVACAAASACHLATAEFDPELARELRTRVQIKEV